MKLPAGLYEQPITLELATALAELEEITARSEIYKDYPISPTRFHWETQGAARAESRTVRRYRGLVDQPWRMLFFVRRDKFTSTSFFNDVKVAAG